MRRSARARRSMYFQKRWLHELVDTLRRDSEGSASRLSFPVEEPSFSGHEKQSACRRASLEEITAIRR